MFLIASTLLHPPALSMVGDLVSSQSRGKALGVFNSAGAFGIALGPISLSFILYMFGWRTGYLLWSIPALFLPALVLKLRVEPASHQRIDKEKPASEFHIFKNTSLIVLLVILGARAVSNNVINTYITPYFVDTWKLDPAMASLIFGLRPLVGILGSPIGGIMVDRVGEKQWIASGLVAQIVSISVMAFSNSLTWMLPSYILYSFFGIMEMPAIHSLITRLTPSKARGLAFSLS